MCVILEMREFVLDYVAAKIELDRSLLFTDSEVCSDGCDRELDLVAGVRCGATAGFLGQNLEIENAWWFGQCVKVGEKASSFARFIEVEDF